MPLYGLATFEDSIPGTAYLQAVVKNIPGGIPGTRVTLEEMHRLVDEAKKSAEVSELTEYVLSKFGGRPHNERSQVEAIRRGLRSGLFYVHDPRGIETLRDGRIIARKMLAYFRGQGPRPLADCDDFTIIGRAQLEFIGIESKSRAVGTMMPGSYNHVFPMARMKAGNWVALEATMRHFPQEGFTPQSTTVPALDVPNLGQEPGWVSKIMDPLQKRALELVPATMERTFRPAVVQLTAELSYLRWVFIGLAALAGAGAFYLIRKSRRAA